MMGACLMNRWLIFITFLCALTNVNEALSPDEVEFPEDPDPCNWKGVTCDSQTKRVIALSLTHHKLRGPLPPELGKLDQLRILMLHNNALYGSIPAALGNCTALYLQNNYLSGTIPSEMGNLSALKDLCTRTSVQQRLQYIQAIQELQEEIKLLQIPNEKLNGEGLNGLSYSEVSSIENMLNQGLVVVEEQTDKAFFDIIISFQIVESVVMGMDWTDKLEKEDLAYQARLSRRRTAVRNKSRELRLSPQDSQQEHSHDHEELMLTIESLKIEKKRLLLLSQRMIGKELDGMSYAELYVLGFDITRALMNVMQEMDKIKHAARVSKPHRTEIDSFFLNNYKTYGCLCFKISGDVIISTDLCSLC
ncbi:unnamed protein product [Brassica napus]|uniref:(rape) hypothetical protein n=1 Tax=Brassica napus TaxID=3708 RepID=A0A816JQL0_BRANA|nr:unnamed protein product [Brassica napus]